MFNDSYAIKVSIANTIMALRYYDLLIIKLETTKKDTIEKMLIKDVPQEHIASSLMFKCMLLRRSHINAKGIPLEVFMQLLIPQVIWHDINLTDTSFNERWRRRYFERWLSKSDNLNMLDTLMGIGQNKKIQGGHGINKVIRWPKDGLDLEDLKMLKEIDSQLPIRLEKLVMTLINAKNLIHNEKRITINHNSINFKIDGGSNTQDKGFIPCIIIHVQKSQLKSMGLEHPEVWRKW